MDIRLNLFAIVLLFALLQGIFYIILFIKRGIEDERTSDFWMAALIAALCVSNLSSMLGFMGIYILGQKMWFFPQDVGLVVGPIIYYYLKTQINTDFRFTRTDLKHFMPYIVYFVYHFSIYILGPDMVGWWAKTVHHPLYIGDITRYLEIISLIVYMTFAINLYRKYLRWLPIERSDTEGVRFDWYKHFLWAMVIGIFMALVFFILSQWIVLSYWEDWVFRAIIAAIIYYISFAAYIQAQPRHIVFDEKKVQLADDILRTEALETIETLSDMGLKTAGIVKVEQKISPDDLEKWRLKIDNIMTQEKLYLNSELTLSELSEKLGTHNSLTSNVINTAFQKNFNDFVNEFRVIIFTEKIKDPKLQHLTLLAIAFDCGFNSKSTFNRAVKKVTGRMPSEFLKT
jgi:AraC-like DNA-binding protein